MSPSNSSDQRPPHGDFLFLFLFGFPWIGRYWHLWQFACLVPLRHSKAWEVGKDFVVVQQSSGSTEEMCFSPVGGHWAGKKTSEEIREPGPQRSPQSDKKRCRGRIAPLSSLPRLPGWEFWPVPLGWRWENGGGLGKRKVVFSEFGRRDLVRHSPSLRTLVSLGDQGSGRLVRQVGGARRQLLDHVTLARKLQEAGPWKMLQKSLQEDILKSPLDLFYHFL